MTMHRSRRFSIGIPATFVAVVFVLAGCSSPGSTNSASPTAKVTSNTAPLPDSAIAAAKKEGTVTFYTGNAPVQANAVAQAFEDKYGIHVEVVRAQSGALTTRYQSEEESGKVFADVILQSDPIFAQTASNNGWFEKLDTKYAPALAPYPAEYVEPYSISVQVIPWAIEYDTSKVTGADIPKTWKDLLNKKWGTNGNLIINSPLGGTSQGGLYNWLYVTYGADFIKQLKTNNPTVVSSLTVALQSMAAGEGEVFLGTTAQSDADLIKQGATLATVTPDQTVGSPHYLSVSYKAPHPNAARLFANFLLSPEGQEPLNAGNAISPLGRDLVPDSLKVPSHLSIVNVGQANQNLPTILKLLGVNAQ